MVNVLFAAVSGFLFFAGFAPFELWFTPYLAAAILFRILCDKSLRLRLTYAGLAGLAFFLPLLHWSSVYVGSAPWLVLGVGESLIFSMIGLIRFQRRWESALTFSTMFTLIELVRMKAPFGGFGWGRLGFTQVDSISWIYPLVGVTGISLLVSSAAFLIITPLKTILSFFLILGISMSITSLLPSNNSERSIQVTAIQGGVDELGINFNERALRVLERHVEATTYVPGTDLYVWPENASDVDPIKNERANFLITNLAKGLNTSLLVGGVERSSQGPINSSILFGKDGEVLSRYTKQDLAPFGEYMPMRRLAEAISPYAEQVTDFVPGNRWVKHSIKGLPFQSLICFEVLDDDHVKLGTEGAAFMVAQTNNATFGKSAEAAQQLQITRARAAETQREFVVVSTTGFTSHLDSRGKVVVQAPQFTPEQLTMKIARTNPELETPAQKLRTWAWALGLALILGLARWKISR